MESDLRRDGLYKAYLIARWERENDAVFNGIVAPGGDVVTCEYREWITEKTPYGEHKWKPMLRLPEGVECGDRVSFARIKGQVRLI